MRPPADVVIETFVVIAGRMIRKPLADAHHEFM
jgi:hypothetical protein